MMSSNNEILNESLPKQCECGLKFYTDLAYVFHKCGGPFYAKLRE